MKFYGMVGRNPRTNRLDSEWSKGQNCFFLANNSVQIVKLKIKVVRFLCDGLQTLLLIVLCFISHSYCIIRLGLLLLLL